MKTDSLWMEWLRAFSRVCRMWAKGWLVIGKSVVAYFVVLIFGGPLGWLLSYVSRSPDHRNALGLALCAAGILVYFPLVVYVAASWVGFCRYVKSPEDETPAGLSRG
jgi:hypothetical protein